MKNIFLLLLLTFFLSPVLVLADGCMIAPDYDEGDVYEPSQTALLVHSDGVEDMYLKVNYEGNASDFIWLVPTPTYPTATTAPADLFLELSALTVTSRWNAPEGVAHQKVEDSDALNTGVIVHEQKTIGIYELTVLSAAGTDSLFTWLNDNGYSVKEEVRDVLDWYVEKEWYFSVMKIKEDDKMLAVLNEFQKIDSTATEENLAEKYADYYTDIFRYKDYDSFLNVLPSLELLIPEDFDELEKLGFGREEFLKLLEDGGIDDYGEIEWRESREEVLALFKEEAEGEEIYKYSDYIEPLKFSFESESVVYPLKISQISTRVPENNYEISKTNEVLLYVLNDEEVMAPGFIREYGEVINKEKLVIAEDTLYSENLNSLKEIIADSEMFLTKMRRDFAKVEMDDDLYFLNGENPTANRAFKMKLFTGNDCLNCAEANDFFDRLKSSWGEYLELSRESIWSDGGYIIDIDQLPQELDISTRSLPLVLTEDASVIAFDAETGSAKIEDIIKNSLLKPLSKSYAENSDYQIISNETKGSAMSDRLKGKILIKVEDEGKAYYLNPTTHYSHYLGRPTDAFQVMREQGVGISNANLEKIPVAIIEASGMDSDNDGLLDAFEDALGTDKLKADSDDDGFADQAELIAGYTPLGAGKQLIDSDFSNVQKGKIFLQVESNGEAWYINPSDGKRYFLGRPVDAFAVMRNLGLGISNKDFDQL